MDRSQKILLTTIIGLIMAFTAGDMIADYDEGSSFWHLSIEACLLILSFFGIATIWNANRILGKNAETLTITLASARSDAEHWLNEVKQLANGLSDAIDRQFGAWNLSVSEKDIGLLLLKGLSLKEVADVRGTSERTVRQQAQEIYRKSGVAGRAEFAAFFLEDLLLPRKSLS